MTLSSEKEINESNTTKSPDTDNINLSSPRKEEFVELSQSSLSPDMIVIGKDSQEVEDPVEILVNLAERGEIDPWNINIIEVTDRFLTELERCRQLNLHISGRTLFYAATLLRMKSEQLELTSADEE